MKSNYFETHTVSVHKKDAGRTVDASLTSSNDPSSSLDTIIFSACCAASTSATPLKHKTNK